jgi:poly(3-hydroxybutyrate) depolymerase
MIFVLHGGGGKAAHMIRLAEGLPEIAKQRHILLVYPQGIDKGWNDGRDTKISTAISENVDDAGFLDSLALKLAADYKIPEDKIFITGISNGGMMSQRLACESRAFRAIASVAANLQESFAPKCKPSAPISTLFILGTEDPLVPYGGGINGFAMTTAATTTITAYTNGLPTREAINKLVIPIPLDSGMTFNAFLDGTATSLTASGSGGTGATFQVYLDGLWGRLKV